MVNLFSIHVEQDFHVFCHDAILIANTVFFENVLSGNRADDRCNLIRPDWYGGYHIFPSTRFCVKDMLFAFEHYR